MLSLDYAKKTENGWILNFFADSEEDLLELGNGKEYITNNYELWRPRCWFYGNHNEC